MDLAVETSAAASTAGEDESEVFDDMNARASSDVRDYRPDGVYEPAMLQGLLSRRVAEWEVSVFGIGAGRMLLSIGTSWPVP